MYGFELEGSYRLNKPFTVYGWLSYVKGDDETAKQSLTNIPPLKTRSGIRYEGINHNAVTWIDISALTAMEQDNPGNGEKHTGGYTVFDIRAGVSINEQ